MKNLKHRFQSFAFSNRSFPLILLFVCLLAYGLLIPWLGLYSDDWIFLATFQKMGSGGLTRYFSTNRPVWGLLYQFTLPLLGRVPWHWHVFGLVFHYTSALTLWGLVRLVWQQHAREAAWAALLFAVYPGFLLQPISLTFGHIFIIYTVYFLSLICLISAYRKPQKALIYTLLGLLFSAVNLLTMEYFFLLHLIQPVFLWIVSQDDFQSKREHFKFVFKRWLPYLAVFIGVSLWRTLFFEYQTNNYELLFLDQLKQSPIPAIGQLLLTVLRDLFNTGVAAWVSPLLHFVHLNPGDPISLAVLGVTAVSLVGILIYLLKFQPNKLPEERRWGFSLLFCGLLALLISGGPFWVTEIPVGLTGFKSRFTLPFIFGAVLSLTGLLAVIKLPLKAKHAIVAVLVSASIGLQLLSANEFRREWIQVNNTLWQMVWRMPDLETNTVIFSDEIPYQYFTEYTLSALIDWVYDPQPAPQKMSYGFYYPRERIQKGSLPELEPGYPIAVDHLGSVFEGNTDRVVTINFADYLGNPGCLEVLDPQLDAGNATLSPTQRTAASLSNPGLILLDPVQPVTPFGDVFLPEPKHTWCYLYIQADKARQAGDWQTVADLWQQAQSKGYTPSIANEFLPFVESYLTLGQVQQADEIAQQARRYDSLIQPTLCKVAQQALAVNPQIMSDPAFTNYRQLFGCGEISSLN
ncbi:MAG: hypothetical protein ABFD29_06100 [Anaerolineaceae bacterium]